MRHIIIFFLLCNLTVNTFAAAEYCTMEHDVVSTQSQSMPCHDSEKEEMQTHLCDCDKCAQYIYSFMLTIPNIPVVESPTSDLVQSQSLEFSPKYRPPIYIPA